VRRVEGIEASFAEDDPWKEDHERAKAEHLARRPAK
jgi:hypothetical protein